jgi:DNA-binding beta-propeller fold protein YncE
MVSVGAEPSSIAVNPVINTIDIANFTGNSVTVIYGATNSNTIDLSNYGGNNVTVY